ncbi:MAG: hypothetical protein GXP43_02770 [bacterium]|nr:hypothetical protein [bacterium]
MQINFRFEKIKAADDFREQSKKMLSRMGRFLASFAQEFQQVWVRVKREGGFYRVKGKVDLPGRQLIVEEAGKNLTKTIRRVRDGLIREVKKYKDVGRVN